MESLTLSFYLTFLKLVGLALYQMYRRRVVKR